MTSVSGPVIRSQRYRNLLSELNSADQTILIDGPISTELDSRGVTMSSGRERRSPVDEPEALIQVHMDYIKAGSRIITTHTFGGNRIKLGQDFEQLTMAAVECAIEARKRTNTEDNVIIAGSLAYHTARGRREYEPDQNIESWEQDINDLVELLKTTGVDVMLLEMVGGPTFTAPIIHAVQNSRMPFWIGFSAYDDTDGIGLRVYDNQATSIDDALPGLISLSIEGQNGEFTNGGDSGVDIVGAMHCKPDALGKVLKFIQSHGWDKTMFAYPDDIQTWDPSTLKGTHGNDPVDVFCDLSLKWRKSFPKCNILGACCGYSVSHIAALSQRLKNS